MTETQTVDLAAALAEVSEGGLTPLGAADLIKHWRTARARYQAVFDCLPEDPRD